MARLAPTTALASTSSRRTERFWNGQMKNLSLKVPAKKINFEKFYLDFDFQ
jgi:hypothetical protein